METRKINKIAFAIIASAASIVLSAPVAMAEEAGLTSSTELSDLEVGDCTLASASVADGTQIAASKYKKIPPVSDEGTRFNGNVSWYGPGFHGKLTACGKKFDMNQLVCAHKTLPFYTKVLVENPKNGKSTTIDVYDRGPFVGDRIIDLSREAARRLGTLTGGVAFVECLIIKEGGKGK